MLRLKSRQICPPGGFLFQQPQTGWENWKVNPASQWDFRLLCQLLQRHRQANPQFRLTTDIGQIEAEVDTSNAMRIAKLPNTETYIMNDQAPVPKSPAPKALNYLRSAAGAVKKVEAGLETIFDFERSGDKPVEPDHAASRAGVCAVCPRNGKGDFTRWFTVPASERIRKHMELKNQRGLTTPADELLGVCEACLCPLKLKVHFPIDFIVAHMDGTTLNALHSQCWILEEMKNERTS
jgi:hypothetical protein